MIFIAAATSQLGNLVIQSLLEKIPASQIIAGVRDTNKAQNLSAKGVTLRIADYNDPDGLERALLGVDKLLLISSGDIAASRQQQHANVIDAAKKAGVGLIAYTSILNADTSELLLAKDHQETEKYLKASGVPYVFLRDGWYIENYTGSIPVALQHGAIIGASGDGKISAAARKDYAEAAAVVLTSDGHENKIYELAGDNAFTLNEYADELSKQVGKTIPYVNLPKDEYAAALVGAGLPEALVNILADSDIGASKGQLYSKSKDLGGLIGRPTTTLKDVIASSI
ncbi:SDR family oxidoreductase [Pseudaquidulcibacter saccharophilus]|uniref:SDR family oxidoreductase n=1 Tax=Pseudaquidulcibacter saccharophilus TaxID=2831900 RepID=UPI001EFF084D|nr:SDR family oxidoreductase [Pseudaquidulcibacter saccharophilus]